MFPVINTGNKGELMKAAIAEQQWNLATPPAYFWLALRQVRDFARVRGNYDYYESRLRLDGSFYYSMQVVTDYLSSFEDENKESVVKAKQAIEWDVPKHGSNDDPCTICPWPKLTDPSDLPTTYPLLPNSFWEALHKVSHHYPCDQLRQRDNDPKDIAASLSLLNRWLIAARNKGWWY